MANQVLKDRLQEQLKERKQQHAFRQLGPMSRGIDFSSNDYLSFARSSALADRVRKLETEDPGLKNGSTGSRLLTGNLSIATRVETKLAEYHQAEAVLVFNSGYDANLGLLSALLQRTDTVIYDAYAHASIRDGIRLGFGKAYSFRHNEPADLLKKINAATGSTWVVIESLYSMDGDTAPLAEIVAICEEKGVGLLLDEAHATGFYGPKGEGLAAELNLTHAPMARIHTFGKALGIHGAAVVGDRVLIDYLLNFARSFIYTTGLSPKSWLAVEAAYEVLAKSVSQRADLHALVRHFCSKAEVLQIPFSGFFSPIQSLIVPGNDVVRQMASILVEKGFDVRPILHPTVPKGQERIRVCLHAHNTIEEVDALLEAIHQLQ